MLKVLLGKNIINKPVYWEIPKEKNPHLLVLGTSGCGKTETLKAIIHDLNQSKVPSLIIDFHNEFSAVGQNILNMREVGINPLEFGPTEKPESIIYEVSGIIKKIFGLGEIQEAILRQAIKNSYLFNGIELRKPGPAENYPTFQDVMDNIYRLETSSNKRTIESLMSRIEPLFELDIFKGGTDISFSELMHGTTVVELKQFPTEVIKSAIAEFFLAKFSYYFYSLEKSKKMKLYCVVDEAHRLMYEGSPLDRFLRESRKYGVGVILASQRPTDFNETVLANAGVLLSFQCTLEKDAKFVGKQLGLDSRKVRNLIEPGTGYVKFSRGEKSERVHITRLKDRLTKEEKTSAAAVSHPTSESKSGLKEKSKTKKSSDKSVGDVPKRASESDKKAPKRKVVEVELDDLEEPGEAEDFPEKSFGESPEAEDVSETDEEIEDDEVDEPTMPQRIIRRKKSGRGRNIVGRETVESLTKLFFYTEESPSRNSLVRAIMISALFILGFWFLAVMNPAAILCFALGLVWTPMFAELFHVKPDSRKLFDIVRFVLSILIVYLFLAY